MLSLTVRGQDGQAQDVGALLDTGFNGFLTLPTALVARLALTYHSEALAMLGDGSMISLRKYEARVLWHELERDVLVLEAEGGPLLGMSLLYGSRVTLDVVDGGPVTVQVLPKSSRR